MQKIILYIGVAVISFASGVFVCSISGDFGRLDQELRAGRDRIAELERQYSDIEKANIAIGTELKRISDRVREAKGIIETISGQGATALEQVRRTLENLKKLKDIIGSIDNSK